VTTDEEPTPPKRRGVRLSGLRAAPLSDAFEESNSVFTASVLPQLSAVVDGWRNAETERLQKVIQLAAGQTVLNPAGEMMQRIAEATRPQIPNFVGQTTSILNDAIKANWLLAIQPMAVIGTSLAPSLLQMSSVVDTALKGYRMAGALNVSQDYLQSQLGILGHLQDAEVRRMIAWTARTSGLVPSSQTFARTTLLGLAPLADPSVEPAADEDDDDELLEVVAGDAVTIEYLAQVISGLERQVKDLQRLEEERASLEPAPETPEAKAIRERGERAIRRRKRLLSSFGLVLDMWLNGNVPEATQTMWDVADAYGHVVTVAAVAGSVGAIRFPKWHREPDPLPPPLPRSRGPEIDF
jgi:hypothetical protein